VRTTTGVDFVGQPGHVPLPIIEKRLITFYLLLLPLNILVDGDRNGYHNDDDYDDCK